MQADLTHSLYGGISDKKHQSAATETNLDSAAFGQVQSILNGLLHRLRRCGAEEAHREVIVHPTWRWAF